jgi:hyperosmotically inducible protein
MMRNVFRNVALAAATLVFVTAPAFAANDSKPLAERVRHELVMLPYYNIFDDLSFRVDQNTGTVYLNGSVTDPVLKSDASHVVKHLEGVQQVVNEIKVLPLSPFDNRIRFAAYRSIYGYGALNRYALGAQPSIHIIVENGHLRLVGVVDTQADKNMVGIRANAVPGVFSVQNDLMVGRS